jgi:tungstate transport system substrate-binding protein
MRRALSIILLALVGAMGGVAAACTNADAELILATTTSTQDSGLLDVLVPMFEEESGLTVKTIAVGSGAALQMARRGDADVVLSHSPAAEEVLVRDGVGLRRTRVMYNDFVIVGPGADPAGIRDLTSASDALAAIAASGARFISRGDDSGTHAMERALWRDAGIDVAGASWYVEAGQGMGATLTIASEGDAYTLADRGTWLALGLEGGALTLLVEGDERLFNVYHVIVVNPAAFPNLTLNTAGADRFREFLLGDAAQSVIATFGVERYGQPVFVPYPED